MKHVWKNICTFWWENLRKRDHLEEPGVDGLVKLRSIFRKLDVGAWTGSNRLRLCSGGEYL